MHSPVRMAAAKPRAEAPARTLRDKFSLKIDHCFVRLLMYRILNILTLCSNQHDIEYAYRQKMFRIRGSLTANNVSWLSCQC
jgi:hypothetical protein